MRAVLTWHSIDPSGSPVSVPEPSFREHVAWLASGAARVVPLARILDGPEGEDAVALTFDDGLASFGAVAAPLLAAAGLPVTVFVVADRVGSTSAWTNPPDPAMPVFDLLSWDELGALAQGGVELGAHTLTHPDLTGLPPAESEREIVGSAARIEAETGVRPRAFAYPYGAHDEATVRLAAGAFDLAVTAELDVVRAGAHPHRVPRLDMVYYRDPARLAEWGTPAFQRRLWVRRAGRRVRRLLVPAGPR